MGIPINKFLVALTSVLVITIAPISSQAKTAEANALTQGMDAAKANNLSVYRASRNRIKDENLKAILYGTYLENNIATVSAKEIQSYLKQNDGVYKAQSVRELWLRKAIKEKNWPMFDSYFAVDKIRNLSLQCVGMAREIAKDKTAYSQKSEQNLALVKKLWQGIDSPDGDCDKVFSHWQKQGLLTKDDVKKELLSAVDGNKPKLFSHVANNYLQGSEKAAYLGWNQARFAKSGSSMAAAIKTISQLDDKATAAYLIANAFDFQARKSAVQAEQLWRDALAANSKIKPYADDALAGIASRAVLDEQKNFLQWVKRAKYISDGVASELATREYLRQKRWPEVLATINKMPEAVKQEIDWRYWRARALEQVGEKKQATALYTEIAKEREFFGFLSADKLGKPYQFNNNPPEFKHVKRLAKMPSFAVVKTLLAHQLFPQARAQWAFAIANLNDDELASAAKLASDWQFHDRAIITAGSARIFDAIDIRFPRIYEDLITSSAKSNSVPPEFIFAIIRQESAFMEQVESHAGALGLMQIMPETGKHIAKKTNRQGHTTNDLLYPKNNIPMGSYYIGSRLELFNDQYPVAIASYNAGAGNAKRWLPANSIDADIWVETITFRETRKYVKRVLEYTVVYRHLMGKSEKKVSDYLGKQVVNSN